MTLCTPTGDLFAWHRALRDANDPDGEKGPVLSRQALALALVLGTFMDGDGITPARFSPGLDRLSRALGYKASDHRKAVSGLLRELQQAGYLLVTPRTGRSTPNLYTAAVPAHLCAANADEEPNEAATSPGGQDSGHVTVEQVAHNGHEQQHLAAKAGPRLSAASTPQITAETAASTAGKCGVVAAHPSPTFSSPSPGGNDAGRQAQPSKPNRVLIRALGRLSPQEADQLLASIAALPYRAQVARRINALCDLGAEEKVVQELARPYAGARNPGAVAAARVRDLHGAYGHHPA